MRIKPISLGLPAKVGTELKIRVVSFDTDAVSCTLYYEVITDKEERLAEGNINLTEEEFAEWGKSNTYLDDLVLEKLGLQLDPLKENRIADLRNMKLEKNHTDKDRKKS
jgi:hypothetical protein